MTIGTFKEVVGTPSNDRLKVKSGELAYGLAGRDRLQATIDPLLGQGSFLLVGGFDNDTYIAARRGLTVVMDYGDTTGQDIGVAKGIGLGQTSFVLDIERRHLLAGDVRTGQLVILIDWKNPRNRIETMELANRRYSYSEIAGSYKRFTNYLGNYSWAKLARQGLLDFSQSGLSPRTVNRAIRTVIKRVEELQGNTRFLGNRTPSLGHNSVQNPLAPPNTLSLSEILFPTQSTAFQGLTLSSQ